LCMSGFDVLPQQRDFVQTALQATASRNMRCLRPEDTEIEEEDLLKALSGWASSLEEVTLGEIVPDSLRGGWSAVLRQLSTMPKLKVFKVWEPSEMTAALFPHANLVTLSGFTKGTQIPLIEDEERGVEDIRYGREYEGRAEVVSGLEELLAKPLPYQLV
jgi:hypothetical protein